MSLLWPTPQATLERELQEIDQLDRDLKELTHEKELFDLEIRKDGAPSLGVGGVALGGDGGGDAADKASGTLSKWLI